MINKLKASLKGLIDILKRRLVNNNSPLEYIPHIMVISDREKFLIANHLFKVTSTSFNKHLVLNGDG